ncbi:PREDICTED: uncharacterized protein LOC105461416 [Wasmannia auropunctata]|uniref:uncharacterized protein LOC105461416 n=1 Tax=Wasmannia auropunctata TaxID=64793 RepID=UPI0005ED9440|nr:PREDICTED: uncharacterized protein LOC105461416 [Wasmannia auropunctata]
MVLSRVYYLKLADPFFYMPGGIDILIGGDWFWNLLCIGQFKIEQLTMQKTRLGWIAASPLEPTGANSIKCNFAKEVDIDRQLTKFWNIEEIQDQRIFTAEEREAEAHFVRTTRRNEDGRFIVSMPFKRSPDELEYERLGHMRKISNERTQGSAYYLPHHNVIRMESLTTKVRVVFDASAATDSGASLNDLQMIGPTIQEDLLAILLKFRTHTYIPVEKNQVGIYMGNPYG